MVSKEGHGLANVMYVVRGLVIVSLLLSACSGTAHAQAADKADAKAVDGFSAAVATAGDQRPSFRMKPWTVGLCLQVTWRRLSAEQSIRSLQKTALYSEILFSKS